MKTISHVVIMCFCFHNRKHRTCRHQWYPPFYHVGSPRKNSSRVQRVNVSDAGISVLVVFIYSISTPYQVVKSQQTWIKSFPTTLHSVHREIMILNSLITLCVRSVFHLNHALSQVVALRVVENVNNYIQFPN